MCSRIACESVFSGYDYFKLCLRATNALNETSVAAVSELIRQIDRLCRERRRVSTEENLDSYHCVQNGCFCVKKNNNNNIVASRETNEENAKETSRAFRSRFARGRWKMDEHHKWKYEFLSLSVCVCALDRAKSCNTIPIRRLVRVKTKKKTPYSAFLKKQREKQYEALCYKYCNIEFEACKDT